MAKSATDISRRSLRRRSFVKSWGHKRGHKMRDNRLIFTQGFIERLETPKARTQYFDLKVQGLLVELMPSGAKYFRFRKKISGKSQRTTIGQFGKISLEEARDEAIKLAARLVDGEQLSHPKNELTLMDLANLYFDQHAEGRCTTVKEMRQNFNRCWAEEQAYKVSKISTECIQLRINKIASNSHYAVANKALTLLRAILNWSIKRKLTKTNPTIGIDKFKEQSRDRFIQPYEFESLLQAINNYPDQRMKDFFLICLYTGARAGNVQSMKWQDVDLNTGIWRIPRTKNGSSQTIQLSELALDILKERFKTKELNPFVFPGGRHAANSKHLQEPAKAWRRILQNAGISNLRIHDLRRSLAAYMVMNNVSTATIMQQLGHRSLAAAQIYQRLNLETAKTATDQAIAIMQHYAEKQIVTKLHKPSSEGANV